MTYIVKKLLSSSRGLWLRLCRPQPRRLAARLAESSFVAAPLINFAQPLFMLFLRIINAQIYRLVIPINDLIFSRLPS